MVETLVVPRIFTPARPEPEACVAIADDTTAGKVTDFGPKPALLVQDLTLAASARLPGRAPE